MDVGNVKNHLGLYTLQPRLDPYQKLKENINPLETEEENHRIITGKDGRIKALCKSNGRKNMKAIPDLGILRAGTGGNCDIRAPWDFCNCSHRASIQNHNWTWAGSDFDEMIKEKEMMYKRYRDEAESARMMEEEKAFKQLRRTLVPNFNNSFLPRKSSRGVTKPKLSRLNVTKRTERRKMVVAATTSSVASNMR
ncbi:hypothetical protein SSX86_030103 [Deinandra increscens subsp. villosa]|uniref:TPX2 C-terminal domain-containing protein n=1 Tax=Deinandra increscens subsp. villosa TaxID=3103831 RepID=A0AAP0CHS2_9ASTR